MPRPTDPSSCEHPPPSPLAAALIALTLAGCGGTSAAVSHRPNGAASASRAATRFSQQLMRSWCPQATAASPKRRRAGACNRRGIRGCASFTATDMTRTASGGDTRGEQARRTAVEITAPQAVVAESAPSWDVPLGADFEREHMQRHTQPHSQQTAGSAPGSRPTRASANVDLDDRVHGRALVCRSTRWRLPSSPLRSRSTRWRDDESTGRRAASEPANRRLQGPGDVLGIPPRAYAGFGASVRDFASSGSAGVWLVSPAVVLRRHGRTHVKGSRGALRSGVACHGACRRPGRVRFLGIRRVRTRRGCLQLARAAVRRECG